jgi:glycosyltransferase involved in cell wall biosynthesis
MLVSVVIPAFNAVEWISETIRTVLDQTYDDLEVIVIDDDSSDRTALVAEDVLQNGRFPYQVVRQANVGVSAARNRGWRAAKGQWVQFLDADDLLHPRKIELQVSRSQAIPAAGVIYSDWQKLVLKSGSWKCEEQIRKPNIGEHALADILMDKNFQQLGSQLFNVRALESRRIRPVA